MADFWPKLETYREKVKGLTANWNELNDKKLALEEAMQKIYGELLIAQGGLIALEDFGKDIPKGT